MTVFESRLSDNVRMMGDTRRTPGISTNQVGWVAAFVWPAVLTAVVAGALLGPSGRVLLWVGVAGVVAMLIRQGGKVVARRVRQANLIIDNAPGYRESVDA
ncbi:hypothetical protein GCM10025867_23420 [Frondihabitans sucicola]|uniref:Uncharacterized protein n=2 Tax=Frondihabitans sucicola TaxID=1268041 RepID=A0ABM8GNS9_9MICO|nr:hypothetical protein GCM10025867_23420 [Frondihabitans sucicola]